jgi:F-type H+-transporting ATPase subunit epsilon
MKTFSLSIITPEETIFSGTAQTLVLPSVCGQMEVLAEHAPAFIMLGKGSIIVHVDDANTKSYEVENGYAQIKRNAVKILPENVAQK